MGTRTDLYLFRSGAGEGYKPPHTIGGLSYQALLLIILIAILSIACLGAIFTSGTFFRNCPVGDSWLFDYRTAALIVEGLLSFQLIAMVRDEQAWPRLGKSYSSTFS